MDACFRGFEGAAEWRPLPVALDAFDVLRESVRPLVGDTPPAHRALLACDEWIANVVTHSGASRLEFGCAVRDGVLEVTFRDDGNPFDPTRDRGEMAFFEDLDMGGMGLILIRQTASQMRYAREGDSNVLALRFALDSEAPGPKEAPLS